MSIEADGTERLREVSDELERREIEVEWASCACGDHLASLYAPEIQAEWVNVALIEECGEEARRRADDLNAEYMSELARGA